MKSELDLFINKPIQSNILKVEEIAYKPISSLSNSSDIEFVSVGFGDTYRDPSSIYLKLQVQLLKNAQGDVHTTSKSGVVNNILHSLFRQVTVYLNNVPISQTSNNYNFRSYLENLLNYGTESASTHLDGSGWAIDTSPMDIIAPATGAAATAATNKGLETRKELFGKSNVIELMGKIHADVFNQPKLLLNNVDLRVVLSLEKDEFCVMEDDSETSHIKILSAVMFMNHCHILPSILLAHERVLQHTNALYPFKGVEVKAFTVPAGSYNLSLDNVALGA